ncbi:MAG: hypothetical protein ABIN80_24305 [Dyadobacter sp.]|uniref:hypothetical protein n=1 Tax=Dyadobacter sp. TaxID=1914288 RepID=UPI0032669C02
MKSPEEKIDEALREALKRKFDNFESVPDPSLSEKVWRALNISDNPGIIQQSIILGLLFLIMVTGTLLFSSVAGNEHDSFAKKNKVFAGKTNRSIGAKPNNSFLAKTNEYPAEVDEPDDMQEGVSVPAAKRKTAQVILAKNHIIRKPKVSFEKEWKAQATHTLITPKLIEINTAEIRQIENAGSDVTGSNVEDFVSSTADSPAKMDVDLLANQPLNLPQHAWNTDSIISVSESKERIVDENKNDWAFIVSAAPLRTFQTLTIGHTNGVIYQNFQFPTSISAQTLGYKFSAGIEKNGFQLLLNYGKFRQSFRYEIARDEYLLQPDKSGEYKVVRKGTPVEENSVSDLVGMSLKKHLVRKSTFLKNYFGDLGLEVNRDLTSRTNMVWINAGFGRELFVDRNMRITFGPYVEYSLMKLRNEKNQFRVQPYQIGLSVGLKYLKK